MNEQNKSSTPLESELRQLSPSNLSANFPARLAESLNAPHSPYPIPHIPSPTSDRCLLTAISLGTLAACFILTLTISDFLNAPPSVSAPIARQAGGQPQSLAEYQQTLAQLESDADLFRRAR